MGSYSTHSCGRLLSHNAFAVRLCGCMNGAFSLDVAIHAADCSHASDDFLRESLAVVGFLFLSLRIGRPPPPPLPAPALQEGGAGFGRAPREAWEEAPGRSALQSQGNQAASWGLETSARLLRARNSTLPGYRCWNKGHPGHQDGTLPKSLLLLQELQFFPHCTSKAPRALSRRCSPACLGWGLPPPYGPYVGTVGTTSSQ